MQTQALIAPRGRGRPRKAAAIPQFPGKVFPINSKPRLRVGVVCEIRGCVQCHANNGKLVIITNEEMDGTFTCRSIGGLLVTLNAKTGGLNEYLSAEAVFEPSKLYRVGFYQGGRHV